MTARSESGRTVLIAPDCPPEVDAMIRREAAERGDKVWPSRPFPWNRKAIDEKVVAERKWRTGTKPKKPQEPCDLGMFSDSSSQLDLVTLANTARKS